MVQTGFFEQEPDYSYLYCEECLGVKSYWLNHGEFPGGRDCWSQSTGWGQIQGKFAIWTVGLASSFFRGGFELSTHITFWYINGILCTEILSTVNLFFQWEASLSAKPFLPSQGESLESWRSYHWKKRWLCPYSQPSTTLNLPKIWNLPIFSCISWHWQAKPLSTD